MTTSQLSPRRMIRRCLPPIMVDAIRGSRTAPSPPTEFTLLERQLVEIAPDIDSVEMTFPASQIERAKKMVLPLADLLSISAICVARRPRSVFEIGTYTGSTTLLMAMNTPKDSHIFTLDLAEDDFPAALRDAAGHPRYKPGSLIQESPHKSRIQQLWGRSEEFDFSEFHGVIDLVYVDADHTYEAVKSDSENAFRMVSPGGMIIWDDYRWIPEHAGCAGVTDALHELARQHDIRQLAGTRLAVYLNR